MKDNLCRKLLEQAIFKTAEIRGLLQSAFHVYESDVAIELQDDDVDDFSEKTSEIDIDLCDGAGGIIDKITHLINRTKDK